MTTYEKLLFVLLALVVTVLLNHIYRSDQKIEELHSMIYRLNGATDGELLRLHRIVKEVVGEKKYDAVRNR